MDLQFSHTKHIIDNTQYKFFLAIINKILSDKLLEERREEERRGEERRGEE
jgi:hypothetical protein